MMIARRAAVGAVLAVACGRPASPPEPVARALTSGPVVGAESRIDEPVYTDRQGDQSNPFAAAGGPGALVVWQNDSSPGGGSSDRLLYYGRLDATGKPLDLVPAPITPASTAQFQSLPAAAWNGDRALVVWFEATLSGDYNLLAARIATDGKVLDPGGIVVSTGPISLTSAPLKVFPSADGFAVFWGNVDGSLVTTRVGRDGVVSTPDGTAIVLPESPQPFLVDAAPVGANFLLLLRSGSPVGYKAIVVDAAGGVVGSLSAAGGVVVTSGVGVLQPTALASNGSTALALWAPTPATGSPATVFGQRLSSSGSWLDAAPFEIRPATGAVGPVGAVWNGTSFIVYWNDTSTSATRARLGMRRIGADGGPVDAQPLAPQTLASAPVAEAHVIWTGSTAVVSMVRSIYTRELSSLKDYQDGVMARALGSDLQLVGADAAPVSTAPNTHASYRAAGAPGGAYVVWNDDRQRSNRNQFADVNQDTYGALVTVAGDRIAQSVSPVATTVDREYDPAVGWDGTQFTVAYQTADTQVQGPVRRVVRVPAAGTPIGAPSAALAGGSDSGNESLLVWNGTNFLLAWSNLAAPYVRRLSPAGAVLDTQAIRVPPPTLSSSRRQTGLGAVALGGTYLLVWSTIIQDASGLATEESGIYAGTVTADGMPSTAATTIAAGPGSEAGPALDTDGQSALISWVDRGVAGAARTFRIMGQRFDATLVALDAAPVAIAERVAPQALGSPAVAWTGTAYAAIWPTTDGSVVSFAGCVLGSDLRCQPGSEMAAADTIPAPTQKPPVGSGGAIVTPADAILEPRLVWTSAGGILFYRRFDGAVNVERFRLFARPVAIGTGGTSGTGGGGGATGTTGSGGAAGTAGSGGAAGTTGSGGAAGTAGSGGAAGTTGSGGAAGIAGGGGAGAAGSSAGAGGGGGGVTDGGGVGGGDASASAGGCGCATVPGRSPATAALWIAMAAMFFARRRRF